MRLQLCKRKENAVESYGKSERYKQEQQQKGKKIFL